MINVNFNFNV